MSERTQTRRCNKSTVCPIISNENKQNKLLNKNNKSLKLNPPLLQTKLASSQPGDKYEQEANQVAEQIMRMPEDGILLRKCAKCDDNKKKSLQARTLQEKNPITRGKDLPSIMHKELSSPGKPLDLTARSYMEPLLGYNFSKVRVHDDEFAHHVTRSLGLEAFALENHIYFGHGRRQPGTIKSSALLEHELGHVGRGESRYGTIQGWSSSGHRTITLQSLEGDTRYSPFAKTLLANTAPTSDYNRPQIIQDMIGFWAGEKLYRAPLGMIAGGIVGSFTPPEQGTQVGNVRISGALPQAILGTGLIPTVPVTERMRGPEGKEKEREELQRTRVTQELANHGEDLPLRNEARMNEYTDKGIKETNCCNIYNGLTQLGYALHIAQDRGSHGDGYTADYVQNKPHSEIDDMAKNTAGLAVAITYSKEVLDRFFNGLTEVKKRELASPLSLQLTQPPVVETILAPPITTPGPSFQGPGADLKSNSGFNLATIRF